MIANTAFVHPTAQVHESAILEHNAYVGEGCIIHENVEIGIGAIVESYTEIGAGTVLAPNAHIGGAPQDLSYKGENTKLKIGENCTIREFATIHRASTKEDGITIVGNGCYIMSYSHIGHDCKIGNEVILSSYSPLSGHVHVEDFVVISGLSGVHQFVNIGTMSMVGGMSRISNDVPPYTLTEGSPPVVHGLNSVGLRRRGLTAVVRSELKKALKIFLNKELLLKDALVEIENMAVSDEVKHFVEFVKSSRRGVIRR